MLLLSYTGWPLFSEGEEPARARWYCVVHMERFRLLFSEEGEHDDPTQNLPTASIALNQGEPWALTSTSQSQFSEPQRRWWFKSIDGRREEMRGPRTICGLWSLQVKMIAIQYLSFINPYLKITYMPIFSIPKIVRLKYLTYFINRLNSCMFFLFSVYTVNDLMGKQD